jgi:hypothetical protein
MQHFWLGCALGALLAVTIAAPLLAPWRIRVRYLATAPMTDPWTGLGLAPRLDMRVVRLSALECREGDVEITVEELDTDRTSHFTLARAGCAPAAVAKLDGWMALRTPLLMITDHGHVCVSGPDGAVTNLSLTREKVR